MKTKSTYSLLVSSQEKGRSLFEGAVYALVVISTVASVFQFAAQPVSVPNLATADRASSKVIVAKAAVAAPVQS